MKTYENFLKKFFNKPNETEIEEKFWDNGQKKSEIWYLNGKLHREDGPAYQQWYENGQKWIEIWKLKGKKHREDGPARQSWFYNGQKNYDIWSLNDIDFSREEWVDRLKKIGSKHYQEQQMLLDMEKYNI